MEIYNICLTLVLGGILMVYIDDDTKDKIKKVKLDSLYFLINFDNVITDVDSVYTWESITNNVKLKKKQTKRIDGNVNLIKKTILDNNMDHEEKCKVLQDIWLEHINLIKELDLTDKKMMKIIADPENFKIRNGVQNLFEFAHDNNIPVIIISEGLHEVIECFLECYKCNYDNIHIIANRFKLGGNQQIIHTLNKNEKCLPDKVLDKVKDKKTAVLFASTIYDINILSKDSLKGSIKIAFLDKFINDNFDIYLNYFNVICTHNTSFDVIMGSHIKVS